MLAQIKAAHNATCEKIAGSKSLEKRSVLRESSLQEQTHSVDTTELFREPPCLSCPYGLACKISTLSGLPGCFCGVPILDVEGVAALRDPVMQEGANVAITLAIVFFIVAFCHFVVQSELFFPP
jgi:hypothetical protein